MSDLKDFVIAAHGGLKRWNQLSAVRAHLLLGGVLWSVKKQDGVIKDSMVRVALHRQFASHYAFEKNGLRTGHPGSGRDRDRGRAGSGGAVGPEGCVRRPCPRHAVGPAPPRLLSRLHDA
jgi:hypothetical protein